VREKISSNKSGSSYVQDDLGLSFYFQYDSQVDLIHSRQFLLKRRGRVENYRSQPELMKGYLRSNVHKCSI